MGRAMPDIDRDITACYDRSPHRLAVGTGS